MRERDQFLIDLERLERRFAERDPELEVTLRDPDLGVLGFVVVWNTVAAIGGPLGRCGKGGTRITPTVSLDEVRMLAKIMTLKNGAAGIALGGAKSGLVGDPSDHGFEARFRRFVELAKPLLVENGGLFGGFGFDIGGRAEHALWAVDQTKSLRSFTGKPLQMGGTDYDKEGIAGLGVAVAARTLLECLKLSVSGRTFAVQGLGAMGAAVVRYLSEMGAVITHLSDIRLGGTCELSERAREAVVKGDIELTRSLVKVSGPLEQVLEAPVDLLIPCAVQNVITGDAAQVRAKYVIEGANNPCSSQARTALFNRGVKVIPDFIANPGGILAAYVELTSDVPVEENAKNRTNVLRAKALTEEKISHNVRESFELSERLGLEFVQAAMFLALQRVLPL